MAYTVKKLAKMSGVSVRTLHYYDEIGLLRPAYVKVNGYRYYGEKELLTLQQILFYRELGFELKTIQKVLGKKDFDKAAALQAHKKVLQGEIERMKGLIKTIDKTIGHMSGGKKMKDEEMYFGFSKEKQAEYERQIRERFGEMAPIEESKQNAKDWTKEQWEQSKREFEEICTDLADKMKRKFKTDSKEVQTIIRRHYHFLKQFWTPNRESYTEHGKFILESELAEAYRKFDTHMPEFIAEAIRIFAEKELEKL